MKRVLLSTSGDTPQVVTETLWCLLTEDDPPKPIDELHVVATELSLDKAQRLDGKDGMVAALARERGVTPPKVFIHVFDTLDSKPLRDIRSGADSAAFAKGIANLVRKLTMNPDVTLCASIAGGRKTMGFLLGQAMALFGRPQDRLTHTLVEGRFEHCAEFWFPTTECRMLENRDGDQVDAREARLELVEIPFVSLRGKLTTLELRAATLEPAPLMLQVQQRIHQEQVTLEIVAVGVPAHDLQNLSKYLPSAYANLVAGCTLVLRIVAGSMQGDTCLRVLIDCRATADRPALARSLARSLTDDVRHALEEHRTGYRVVECLREPDEFVPEWVANVAPKSVLLAAPWVKGIAAAAPEEDGLNAIRLRMNDATPPSLGFPVQAMVACDIPMEFQWSIERVDLGLEERALVDAVHEKLTQAARTASGEFRYSGNCVLPAALTAFTTECLMGWKQGYSGFRTSVCLRAASQLPSALLSQVASVAYVRGESHEIHMGETIERNEGNALDLSVCFASNQNIYFDVPSRTELLAAGIATALPAAPRRLNMTGIVLGTSGQNTIRLSPKDRDQHMHVLGGSGTGKSTLLRNMVIQDIDAGEGVFVLDPHGDLVDEILDNVPADRAEDVILLDVGDTEYPFGLNFLQLDRDNPSASIAYITNELLATFQRLYGGTPEAMGPMFEQLFRAGIGLLLDRESNSPSTFLDLLDVYADGGFRAKLLRECRSQAVRRMIELQQKGSGDHSWENFASYVTNKFNRFTLNAQVRNIVCQPHSTVDFRAAMDGRKIVLVKMAKGRLGELDVQMIGTLIVSRLFGAALARADVAPAQRCTLNVYIDEFHNFVTATIGQMIAEGRKYGLRLVLANQSLAQLDPSVCDSVLGNAANLLVFRLGPKDAAQMEGFFTPALRAANLQALSNFQCAARILHDGAPLLPSFVLHTLLPLRTQGAAVESVDIVAYSRNRYSRPRHEVEMAFQRQC